MTKLFEKTRDFVEESFNNEAQMLHFDRTVYWVQELQPSADEAFLIAAIGHDIERAFRDSDKKFDTNNRSFKDAEHLKRHQEEGARILGDFLKQQGADKVLIERVKHLVRKHEEGGDADQNLLMDADSVSFVENNVDIFLRRFEKLGYNRIKEKFDWMFERISSEKAREIARPMYEKMIKTLHKKR